MSISRALLPMSVELGGITTSAIPAFVLANASKNVRNFLRFFRPNFSIRHGEIVSRIPDVWSKEKNILALASNMTKAINRHLKSIPIADEGR